MVESPKVERKWYGSSERERDVFEKVEEIRVGEWFSILGPHCSSLGAVPVRLGGLPLHKSLHDWSGHRDPHRRSGLRATEPGGKIMLWARPQGLHTL